MAYPNLNWLIPWYVEDYLPLDREQEVSLRTDLDKVLSWHCQNELFRYSLFLRETATQFNERRRIDTWFIEDQIETMAQFYRDLVLRVEPDIVRLLRAATNKQISALFHNLEKENLELLEKYDGQSPEERNQQRQQRMKKQLQKWLGDLTEEQQQALALWSGQIDGTFPVWINNRRHLQGLFRQIIAEDRFLPDFPKKMTRMLTTTEEYYTADYRLTARQSRTATSALLARVGSLLTDRQRERLVDRLIELADDLDALRCL